MPSRKKSFTGMYHVYSRGVRKLPIGHDEYDFARAMISALILQFGTKLPTNICISNEANDFIQGNFDRNKLEERLSLVAPRIVEVYSFCIMNNHIHVVIRELVKNGTTLYMKRLINSLTTFYNKKYKTSGRLFSTHFKSVAIETERQLKNVINYVHLNPYKYDEWFNNEINYPYSSFQDYEQVNRWGSLLVIPECFTRS